MATIQQTSAAEFIHLKELKAHAESDQFKVVHFNHRKGLWTVVCKTNSSNSRRFFLGNAA